MKTALKNAICLGYKHIDCAWVYGNEKEIGECLSIELGLDKIDRRNLFVTSKVCYLCEIDVFCINLFNFSCGVRSIGQIWFLLDSTKL